jgi:hypothetical protein
MDRFFAGILIGLFSLFPYFIRRNASKIQKTLPPPAPVPPLPNPKTPERKQTKSLKQCYQSPAESPSTSTLETRKDLDQVEILLHNVSHTDMVLSVLNSALVNSDNRGENIIARPKFSWFREISTKIENKIRDVKLENLATIKHSAYSRDSNSLHRIIRSFTTNQELDVGFDLQNHGVVIDRIEQLRFRQNDRDKMSNEDSSATLSAVYFPLLSMLIPKWLTEVDSRGKGRSRKIVFLVSGQGTPRDETARVQDNSTEITAMVMEMFLKKVYPSLEVVQVPSPTINLFRYADNIVFVKRMLKPKLDAIRNDLAAKIGGRWLENLHVTMSFADGSSARISAISASIRSYRLSHRSSHDSSHLLLSRPSYMHFWQLKTFWYETKVTSPRLCPSHVRRFAWMILSATPTMRSLLPHQCRWPTSMTE